MNANDLSPNRRKVGKSLRRVLGIINTKVFVLDDYRVEKSYGELPRPDSAFTFLTNRQTSGSIRVILSKQILVRSDLGHCV